MPDPSVPQGPLPFEVHVVQHEPECGVGGFTCSTDCVCSCHDPYDWRPLAPQRPPMGEFGGHLGSHVWKNGAELVWECDDACFHPIHAEEHP